MRLTIIILSIIAILAIGVFGYEAIFCNSPCTSWMCKQLMVKDLDDIPCCPGEVTPTEEVTHQYVFIRDIRPGQKSVLIPKDRDSDTIPDYIKICPCDTTMVLVDTSEIERPWKIEDEDFVKASKPKGEGNFKYSLPDLPYPEWVNIREDSFGSPSQHVKIAILDSGFDERYNSSFGANGVDDKMEMFEFTDDVHDSIGHGSVVTTIISRISSQTSRYLIYKCINDEGYGTSFSIACAIRCAQNKGADLINLSLGAYVRDTVVRRALNRNRISAVIASKGNDCIDTNSDPHFPSDFPGVFGIAALKADALRPYSGTLPVLWTCTNGMQSSTGAALPLLCAPARVVSPAGHEGNGTSFAAAHFTGLCAQKLYGVLPSPIPRPTLINEWLDEQVSRTRYLYATESCVEVLALQ